MRLFPRIFGRAEAAAPEPQARTEPPLTRSASEPGRRAAGRRVRKYMAARPDRIAGGFEFSGLPTSNPELARQALRGLVSHARFTARNADYARAFLLAVRRNVIGPSGIRLAPRAKDPDGSLDRRANELIAEAWRRWGELGSCSVCGELSWGDIERMAAMVWPRDGNFLLRLYRGRGFGPFGFQLQPLSIDQLDVDYNAELGGGRHVAGGVEMDGRGRRLAYHMWSRHPGASWGVGQLERRRIPAAEIIHLFPAEDPGQFLGVPPMHTALRRLNMLNHYEQAALSNAMFGARSAAFLKRTELDDAPTRTDAEGDEEEAVGDFDLESGSVLELPPGYDLASFDPAYPDGEMAPFAQHMLRGSAAGLGMSYHGLANDLTGANFSSLHYGANEERDEWRMVQAWLIRRLHHRVYLAWLEMALMTELRLPMGKYQKFAEVLWRPRGWPAVNPKDEANSSATNLANALTSPQRELAKRGEDFEEVLEDLAEAIGRAKAAGVPLDFLATGTAAAGAPGAGGPPGQEEGQ